MTKQTGLGDNFYLDGYDLSNATGALGTIRGGLSGTQDMTGINKSAHERLGLTRDGELGWTAFFDPGVAAAHDVLSTLVLTSRICTYTRGTSIGSGAACLVGKQLDYAPTRGADGSLTIGVSAVATDFGMEWGDLLTAGIRTDTGATNGASRDFGTGSKNFGAQAWLHVFSFTGTNATIKIQSSSDNGGGDPFTDVSGLAFTQVTAAPFSQRLATGRTDTIERYLRAVTTTAGGFSSMSFAVIATRNDTLVNF